jgi:pimeloyl-ACP methyl ester carboxylesterase
LQSKQQWMTAGMIHVTNLTPGSASANPKRRRVLQHVGWAPPPAADEIEKLNSNAARRRGGGSDNGGEDGNNGEDDDGDRADGGGGLVLCGLSLGGVVSLRYIDQYPSEVARIILVSSPGLDERWWVPSRVTYPLRQAVLDAADAADAGWFGGDVGRWAVRNFTPLKTFLSHINLVGVVTPLPGGFRLVTWTMPAVVWTMPAVVWTIPAVTGCYVDHTGCHLLNRVLGTAK